MRRFFANHRDAYKWVLIAGLGLVLALGSSFFIGAKSSATSPRLFAPSFANASESDQSVQRSTYSNTTQGYSILIQGDVFGVYEQYEGAGQTIFYLFGSVAETDAVFGSIFTVFYDSQMTGFNADEFFGELVQNVRADAGDSFEQVNQGDYSTVTIAGVDMPAAAWFRTSPDSGCRLFEMRMVETMPDGGVAVWSMSAEESEIDVTLQGLTEAVATFNTNPSAYGTGTVTVSASSLLARPGTGSLGSGGSTSGGGATSTGDSTQTPAPTTSRTSSITYTPVEFTDGRTFTIKVPQGWKVTWLGGDGLQALIDVYDPDNPAIRMCFWGTQEIPASQAVASMYGLPFVMQKHTVAEYVSHLGELSAFAAASGQPGYPTWLTITNSDVIGFEPASAVTDTLASVGRDWIVSDEAVVIANFTMADGAGTPVAAIIHAVVIPNNSMPGMEFDSVQLISVVTAPPDMLEDVVTALIQSGCFGSFTVIGSSGGSGSGGSGSSPQTGGSGYDASAAILDSYYYQQQVQDDVFQAWDDYILGRDRFTLDSGDDLLVYYE